MTNYFLILSRVTIVEFFDCVFLEST